MTGEHEATARERWAWHTAFVLLAVAYAALRLHFGEEYRPASWARLLEGRAPLPFGHRVLAPWLVARIPTAWVPSVEWRLGIVEALAAFGLLEAMAAALSTRRSLRSARRLAVAGLVVLGVAYLVPRRWPIFYPWDTPALVVLAAAVALAERRRYGALVVLAGLGALNRESGLLVPAIVLALRIDDEPDRRGLAAWVAAALAAALAARVAIELAYPDNPGPPLHFTVHGDYRLHENLRWLASPAHVAAALGWGGWLLLAWPWRARVVGWPWRRLGAVAIAWVCASMLVANVYEPRAFGEAIVLGLLGVAAGRPTSMSDRRPVVRWFDATWGWLCLAGLVAIAVSLRAWSWLPIAQWPMPR